MYKNKKKVREKVFGIRLNTIEKAKLEIASDNAGLTPSAYIRKKIFKDE